MASWKWPVVAALTCLALVLRLSESLTIDVYRNGKHVKKYEDKNAEFDGRSVDISTSPIRGQMHYAAPFRNACEPVNPVNRNLSSPNWFALIDNFLVCPEFTATYLQQAGYSMMIAYAERDVELYATPSIPRCLVSSSSFIAFLRNNTIVGSSPNADQYTVKVQATSWFLYEKLFIIFGAILLAAVVFSVLIFCCSVFCRTVVSKWRTRGLSQLRVRQLPKRRFQKDKETIDSCSICLEDFKNGERLRVLPCDHIFHPKCVDEWLRKWNRTCPLCKSTITRRRASNSRPSPSSTTDNEQSHLLNSEGEDGQDGEQDSYGATGHSDNPLHVVAATNLEREGGRNGVDSVHTTVELSGTDTPSEIEGEGVEHPRSSLLRNEDSENPVPTNMPDSSRNTQQV